MPGAGIRPGIMNDRPRLLDVTRLVSRIGRGPLTGVDRVEAAYLAWLGPRPDTRLLCRTPYGFLLLPGAAGGALRHWLTAPETLPSPDLLDRLRRRTGPQARAEAGLRRLAEARGPHRSLGRMVARALPTGGSYLNLGHSNLTGATLGALAGVPGLTVAVMIHDTIPLDHSEFCREGESVRFAAKLAAVFAHANLILCNSAATRADVFRHAGAGRRPACAVAHLGIDLPQPDPAALPPWLDLTRPWFVCLGTIEPRKNHALLLDAWDHIARRWPEAQVPQLMIVGRRGWRNAETFARLDVRPQGVVELPGLPDGAVAALLAGARGLLMPSHAEGFGLPMLEAAALGVPVLATPTPAAHEVMGQAARFLPPDDPGAWAEAIMALAGAERGAMASVVGYFQGPAIPSWTDHFNIVLRLV